MLQKKVVERKTFQLLTELMQEPILDSTRLVGGTALALQLGHRKSTDLDLFTAEEPDIESIAAFLKEKYDYIPQSINRNSTIGFINGIKIDIIHHPFKWIAPVNDLDGIRLANIKDIAAMKIHAITNSGSRPKDFVDIAYLSQYFSYNQDKAMAMEKYPIYDPIMFDRAILFFDDVQKEKIKEIKMTETKMDWNAIKKRLVIMTDNPDKIFTTPPLKPIPKNSLKM